MTLAMLASPSIATSAIHVSPSTYTQGYLVRLCRASHLHTTSPQPLAKAEISPNSLLYQRRIASQLWRGGQCARFPIRFIVDFTKLTARRSRPKIARALRLASLMLSMLYLLIESQPIPPTFRNLMDKQSPNRVSYDDDHRPSCPRDT